MELPIQYERPTTLEVGHEYLLLSGRDSRQNPVFVQVQFASYDPCPAFVIVRNGLGRLRCARDDIFMK